MKKVLFTLCFFSFLNFVFAQDLKTTEIIVIEGFEPKIPHAVRINKQASFSDTTKIDKAQNYTQINTLFYSPYIIREINPAKVKHERPKDFLNYKIDVRLGSLSQNKGLFAFNKKHSKSIFYGFSLTHYQNSYKTFALSNPIRANRHKIENNSQSVYGFLKYVKPNSILSINLTYDRNISMFNFSNKFRYSKISFNAISKKPLANGFTYNTHFFVADLNEMSENKIHFSSVLVKKNDDNLISFSLAFNNYLNYSRDENAFGREAQDIKEFIFYPSTSIYKLGFKIDLGLNLEYQDDSLDTEVSIFPHIQLSKEIVNDFIFLQVGLRDDNKRNSLRSISESNQFIHSYGTNQQLYDDGSFSQELKKTYSKEAYFLLKNQLSTNQFIVLNTSFSKINNILYFQRENISAVERFVAKYKDVNQINASLNYSANFNRVVALSLLANYYNFFDENVPYHPEFVASLAIPISLRDKLKIIPNFSFTSGRSTLTVTNTFIEPPELVYEIEDYFDVDLSIRYNYSKKLSFNLELNNITGQKNELWHGYLDYGFNVLFGLKYSF
jgi:hypothetical protein